MTLDEFINAFFEQGTRSGPPHVAEMAKRLFRSSLSTDRALCIVEIWRRLPSVLYAICRDGGLITAKRLEFATEMGFAFHAEMNGIDMDVAAVFSWINVHYPNIHMEIIHQLDGMIAAASLEQLQELAADPSWLARGACDYVYDKHHPESVV